MYFLDEKIIAQIVFVAKTKVKHTVSLVTDFGIYTFFTLMPKVSLLWTI